VASSLRGDATSASGRSASLTSAAAEESSARTASRGRKLPGPWPPQAHRCSGTFCGRRSTGARSAATVLTTSARTVVDRSGKPASSIEDALMSMPPPPTSGRLAATASATQDLQDHHRHTSCTYGLCSSLSRVSGGSSAGSRACGRADASTGTASSENARGGSTAPRSDSRLKRLAPPRSPSRTVVPAGPPQPPVAGAVDRSHPGFAGPSLSGARPPAGTAPGSSDVPPPLGAPPSRLSRGRCR
jgi:hypothetical protein